MGRLRLEKYDGTNITYSKALEIARVRVDAFRNDALQVKYLPWEERLDPKAIPPLINYEQLRKKCELFERCVYRCSHVIYYKLMSQPRLMTFILVNEDTNKIISHAEWSLPTYVKDLPFELTFKRRAYNFVVNLWFHFLDYVLFPTPSLKNRTAEFLWAAELSGLAEGKPHTLETLRSLKTEELRNIPYPRDLCYFLVLIGVRSECHGQGVGREMIHRSMEQVRKIAIPPPGVDGPPKVAWQSVHTAKGFYARLGFHKGRTVISEKGFDHTVFFANLD